MGCAKVWRTYRMEDGRDFGSNEVTKQTNLSLSKADGALRQLGFHRHVSFPHPALGAKCGCLRNGKNCRTTLARFSWEESSFSTLST